MPYLARITLYPIKSLDGVDVPDAGFLPSGPLENDRRWAIFDKDGQLINGKHTPAVQRIRAKYSSDIRTVQLSIIHGSVPESRFDLAGDHAALEAWLADALGMSCTVRESVETAFPDDLVSSGPTIIASGTLCEVGRWFNLPVDEVHRRFRPNLVIDADEPFWEDRLFGPSHQRPVRFTIGNVRFYGMNPCERCIVPTRSSTTGEPLLGFARTFARLREESLPAWANRDAFDHFYRLMINTRLAPGQDSDLRIGLGDELVVHTMLV